MELKEVPVLTTPKNILTHSHCTIFLTFLSRGIMWKGDFMNKLFFSIHIDKTKHSQKPTQREIGGIRNRLDRNQCKNSYRPETTIEYCSMAIQQGYTFMPCHVEKVPETSEKSGKYRFISQQIIFVDIDNAQRQERVAESDYFDFERIQTVLAENGIRPAIIYHTFSSKPDYEKFRVVVLLDVPITDEAVRDKCVNALYAFFGNSADSSCRSIEKLFFGSTPNSIVFCDETATTTAETLLQLHDRLIEPESELQSKLDGNQSEDNAQEPLNISMAENGVLDWNSEIVSGNGDSPTHTGGIDKTLSPDFDPDVLLNMIDVNALDEKEWSVVTKAFSVMNGTKSIWESWNSLFIDKDGKGTKRKFDERIWKWGDSGNPGFDPKAKLIYYAKLHSPSEYDSYVKAMNQHSRKFKVPDLSLNKKSAQSSVNDDSTHTEPLNIHPVILTRKDKIKNFWATVHDIREGLFEQNGRRGKKPKLPFSEKWLKDYMEAYEYYVEFDEITRDFLYKGFNGSTVHLPETTPTRIEDDLQYDFTNAKVDRLNRLLTKIGTDNTVNPIRTMIESTVWDGKDRLEEWYQLFAITDDFSTLLIKKWSMQAICGLYNTFENPFSLDIALVFQGKQGIGKTRFFEHLAMNPKYFKEGAVLDPTNKDSVIECTGKWITELGEIGSTMRKDVDRLKAFLSLSMDEYRKPYERNSLKYPRRTSYVGTVNDDKFLLDTTGNRRFATIPLNLSTPIPYEKIKAFDSLQFWAQMYSIVQEALKNGETLAGCFRLNENEKNMLEVQNSQFVKPLKGEQEVLDILTRYKIMNPNNVDWKFTTVTDWMNEHWELKKYSAIQIGKVLNKIGIKDIQQKINGSPTHGKSLPFQKRY